MNLDNLTRYEGAEAEAKRIAKGHGLTLKAMFIPCRAKPYVNARYALMTWLHRERGLSPGEIGRALEMDRTTVLYALGKRPV